MVSVPAGIHSYRTLRNRWLCFVLIFGGLFSVVGYMTTSSVLIAAACFLIGQVVALADYFRLRKATDVWIEDMLSDLHIDIDSSKGTLTPSFVLEQWEIQMKKERSNVLMTRGKDARGFTSGIAESELDSDKQYASAHEREEYKGIEEELTVAQQVRAEADQRYAEHAQRRWEESERNDPDLIEAGVERLGDLVTTDYFEKNHDANAVSNLMDRQSSKDDS